MGERVRAMIPEMKTAPARVRANSLNKEPVIPPIKAIGAYTAAKVSVIEITGIAISRQPIIAARKGVSPSFMCLSTFSSTTMASSTTSPIARTIASKVIRFHEKPNSCIIKATPIKDKGMVTIGIITARKEPTNKVMTINTIKAASIMVLMTSLIDSLMAMVES